MLRRIATIWVLAYASKTFPSSKVHGKWSIPADILASVDTLAEDPTWRKLLFIPDRVFPSHRSIIDDHRFFLSPAGKSDPRAELIATLEAFFSSKMLPWDQTSRHPQCIWAARLHFLEKKLGLYRAGMAKWACPKRDEFLAYADYKAVSLVFSNYYANSPSSMFGHTFLRCTAEGVDLISLMISLTSLRLLVTLIHSFIR